MADRVVWQRAYADGIDELQGSSQESKWAIKYHNRCIVEREGFIVDSTKEFPDQTG